MGCCGQKREQLLKTSAKSKQTSAFHPAVGGRGFSAPAYPHSMNRPASRVPQSASGSAQMRQRYQSSVTVPVMAHSPNASADPSAVPIRYLKRSKIRVPGPVTGRMYEFSAAKPLEFVDARDASALVRMRFFARA